MSQAPSDPSGSLPASDPASLPRAQPLGPVASPPPGGPPPYPPPWWVQPPPARRRRWGWLVTLIISLGLGLAVVIGLASLIGSGKGDGFVSQDLHHGGKKVVAVVPLYDVIDAEMAKFATRLLSRLQTDSKVCAVVLRIDSPGGTVQASDEINHAVTNFRKNTGKPVVVSQGGFATSGGYYISAAADTIFSEPTTWTGNIGVIMTTMSAREGLENKLGVKTAVIVSKHTPYKDSASLFKDLEPKDREYLTALVEVAYERFVDVIVEGRPALRAKSREEVRAIANGKVYTAQDAQRLGLIDRIGYLEDAWAEAGRLAGQSNPSVHIYSPRGLRLTDLLSGQSTLPAGPAHSDSVQQVRGLMQTRLLYLFHESCVPSWPTMDYSNH